jgi:Ca-activated chloride channel family protein
MEPNKETKVSLSYTHMLREDAGVVELDYPLRSAKPSAGTVGQLVVKVTIESTVALKNVTCPTHNFDVTRKGETGAVLSFEGKNIDPNRDVQVVFSRDARDIGLSVISHKPGDSDGYFLLTVSPKVEIDKSKVSKKDVVFVCDTSGSMMADGKLDQAKRALKYCVRALNKGDRFSIIAFSGDVRHFQETLVARNDENVEAAEKYIGEWKAAGGTAFHEAVQAGLKLAQTAENVPMVIFLTDGNPTVGEQDVKTILKKARSTNADKCRLFVFGVGYDVNTKLLDLLAEQNRGTRQYVKPKENIEVEVSSFHRKVSYPVLSDVSVDFGGAKVEQIYPKTLPDLFHGSQLTMLGRFKQPGGYKVKLAGKVGGETREFAYDVKLSGRPKHDYLPRLWALRKVAFLLDEIRLHGEKKELIDEVTRLGKRHGIITPYTSFLVVEEGAPVPVALRRELKEAGERARASFARRKAGRGAVQDSADLAKMKSAPAAPAAKSQGGGAGGNVLGIGGGRYGGLTGKKADEKLRKDLHEAVRQTIHHVGGKTFYTKDDGTWVDSEYDAKDKPEIKAVKLWSDDFLELARRHPVLGKVLTETDKVIICLGGEVYRIK